MQPAARHLFERSLFRAVATSIPPHMYSLQSRRFCFRAVATSEHSVAVSDRISNQKHDPEVDPIHPCLNSADPVVLCYFALRADVLSESVQNA